MAIEQGMVTTPTLHGDSTYILKEIHKFVNVLTTGEVHYVLQLETSGKYQGLLIMHACTHVA